MYSTRNLFPKLSNSGQNSEELSAVACSFGGSRAVSCYLMCLPVVSREKIKKRILYQFSFKI